MLLHAIRQFHIHDNLFGNLSLPSDAQSCGASGIGIFFYSMYHHSASDYSPCLLYPSDVSLHVCRILHISHVLNIDADTHQYRLSCHQSYRRAWNDAGCRRERSRGGEDGERQDQRGML